MMILQSTEKKSWQIHSCFQMKPAPPAPPRGVVIQHDAISEALKVFTQEVFLLLRGNMVLLDASYVNRQSQNILPKQCIFGLFSCHV